MGDDFEILTAKTLDYMGHILIRRHYEDKRTLVEKNLSKLIIVSEKKGLNLGAIIEGIQKPPKNWREQEIDDSYRVIENRNELFTRTASDILKSGYLNGSRDAAIVFRVLMIANEIPTSFVFAYKDGVNFSEKDWLDFSDFYCFCRVFDSINPKERKGYIVDPFTSMTGFSDDVFYIDMEPNLRFRHPFSQLDYQKHKIFLKAFANHSGSYSRHLEHLDNAAMGIYDLKDALKKARELD